MTDHVNHPQHYNAHPSGVECITITQHMNFCLGNAVKYIWRADLKGKAIEDLEKARWYISKEIERRGGKKEQRQCYVAPDGLILVPLITGYGSFQGCVYSFGPHDEGREIDRISLQKIVSERQYAAR